MLKANKEKLKLLCCFHEVFYMPFNISYENTSPINMAFPSDIHRRKTSHALLRIRSYNTFSFLSALPFQSESTIFLPTTHSRKNVRSVELTQDAHIENLHLRLLDEMDGANGR
eukprot:c18763_g1_i2 orf=189-527(-)